MSDSPNPVVVWFRRDLRTSDHPALHAAAETGKPVVALYIREDDIFPMGAASDWFLHHTLRALDEALSVPLIIRKGKASDIVPDVVRATGADEVHWGRRYQADGIAVDKALKERLGEDGVRVESHNTCLLAEPWEIKTGSGSNYRVFTPFYRKFREEIDVPEPLPAPELSSFRGNVESLTLDDLDLLPTEPDWAAKFARYWDFGEEAAQGRMTEFLDESVKYYAEFRDRPDYDRTSRMSPHLVHGSISPRQAWHMCADHEPSSDKFLSELGWRNFSYSLLFYNPEMKTENINGKFDGFPWQGTEDQLEAWRRGRTGYPIVDAGMRQLWEMGWQHNRIRMITASFLIKHLLVDWRRGEEWFWDCLCGGDPANNAQGWQWVAGSGADASPFFRIFNPITQGERYDPMGDYVRHWVPELRDMPKRYIHKPWEAPKSVLSDAGVILGDTYPKPMVDHGFARERALAAYKESRE